MSEKKTKVIDMEVDCEGGIFVAEDHVLVREMHIKMADSVGDIYELCIKAGDSPGSFVIEPPSLQTIKLDLRLGFDGWGNEYDKYSENNV